MPETATLSYTISRPVKVMVNIEPQLFTQIKAGDEKAYERLFRQFYEPLCQYAHTFLKDVDEAEEAVQHVFITIWNKKENIVIDTSLKSYLYRAVTNTCLNKIKQHKNRQKHHTAIQHEQEQQVHATSEMVVAGELEKQIEKAVNNLPDQCRLVFELSRYEGLRYHEISEQLDISVKTVENHIGKALKLLRDSLKEYLPLLLISLLTLIN